MEERLHKVLAAAGVASRREAERLIADGRVAVDGRVVTEMGVKVDPDQVRITVDRRPVDLHPKKLYVLLNKPKGYVTTRSDPHAEHTVMELLEEVPESVHPVGRLDKDTEGALLFTNDGELTQLLTHPRHGVPKLYQARIEGVPDEKALQSLRNGVRLEDGMTAPAQVRVLNADAEADRSALEIVLKEGRNRQVRRMLEAVGHPVRSLRRAAIGPVSVRKLPVGAWRYLSQKEVHALLRAARQGGSEAPAELAPDVGEEERPAQRRQAAGAPRTPSAGGTSRTAAATRAARSAGARPRGTDRRTPPPKESGRPARSSARPATGSPRQARPPGERPSQQAGRQQPPPSGGATTPAAQRGAAGGKRRGGGSPAPRRPRPNP